jgi:hypothetical protein
MQAILAKADGNPFFLGELARRGGPRYRPVAAVCRAGDGAGGVGRSYGSAALSTAIELYRTMDMTVWLPQAEAAMASLRGGMGK